MKTIIRMSDIPVRNNAGARFIIQNENVKFELDADSYSSFQSRLEKNGYGFSLNFKNRDLRERFWSYIGEKFTIIEINENGEQFYQNAKLSRVDFDSCIYPDGTRIESSLSFYSENY